MKKHEKQEKTDVAVRLDAVKIAADEFRKDAFKQLAGYRCAYDYRLSGGDDEPMYSRVRQYENEKSGVKIGVAYDPPHSWAPPCIVTLSPCDQTGMRRSQLEQILAILPNFRFTKLEIAHDFCAGSVVNARFARRHLVVGKSQRNKDPKLPNKIEFGSRKSPVFARAYWKKEILSFRIEIEFHREWLVKFGIKTTNDFLKLPDLTAPYHIAFYRISPLKLSAALARLNVPVREAFRYFLAGETSYTQVGREIGIEPFNLRNILRNPIYIGWRVYNKRRDPSPRAMRVRRGGRQGDRPKIQRAPDDIIRVKVLEPLIREEDFWHVQQILDLKKENHWRVRPEHERRFTYSGFLRCGTCGNLIYTHAHKPRDWYVCKSRTSPERGLREKKGLRPCRNPYMRRERVESLLDMLFSRKLTDHGFLERIASECIERSQSSTGKDELLRLQRMHKELEQKRKRVLEAYFDNLVDRAELDRRLKEMETDRQFCEQKLLNIETETYEISAEELAIVFTPLQEWGFLSRNDKRRLLRAIVPEIHIQNYDVTKIALLVQEPHRDEINHTDKDSSPPQA